MHLLWELNIYTVTYIVIKLRFLNICVRILIGSSIRIQKEKLIHALSSRRGIRRCSWSTALRSLGHIFFHAQCLLHGWGILRVTKHLFYKMPKFYNATSFSLLCLGFHACIFLISWQWQLNCRFRQQCLKIIMVIWGYLFLPSKMWASMGLSPWLCSLEPPMSWRRAYAMVVL